MQTVNALAFGAGDATWGWLLGGLVALGALSIFVARMSVRNKLN